MLKLICHTLPSTTNSLYAESLIPQDIYEEINNHYIGKSERTATLLDCIEARIEIKPSDLAKIVRILGSDHFLDSLAKALVNSYREHSS